MAPRLDGWSGLPSIFVGRPFVTLDQQPHAGTVHRHGGGVEQRLARNELLGLPDVGNELLGRLAGAGAHASQCERRSHQLQEAATADGIEPLRGVLRKLAVKELLELGGLGDSLEAAPVLAPAGSLQPGAERLDVLDVRS